MSVVIKLANALSMKSATSSVEMMPIALAISVAKAIGTDAAHPGKMLCELANRLPCNDQADALVRVRDWLYDTDLSPAQLEIIAKFLSASDLSGIDWTSEFDAMIDDARYRESFVPISTRVGSAIGTSLEIPQNESVSCIFAGSATIAWGLAADRPVTFHVTNWQTEIIMALLAFVDGRPLKVDRRNPVETIPTDDNGSFRFGDEHAPVSGAYDHLVAVPPLGYRMQRGPAAGMLFEAWQTEQLAHRARRSFVTLATDGILFRESRNEAEFRERLCQAGALTVTSLPPGIFGRASGVQVNLLRLEPGKNSNTVLVDGRTMDRVSRSGREQEELVVAKLQNLATAKAMPVSEADLAAANFNLMPGRYLVSDDVARLQQALATRQTVRLGDIAKIIRARAPQPNRGEPADDDIEAWEIAVGDLVDGKVKPASKQVRYSSRERSSLSRLQVEGDDILVSIKGNVGVVGIVERDENSEMLDDMWDIHTIVSQSLAIVRPAIRGPFRSPRILAAILASPQMHAHFQALAGGTTVATLPISVLQDLEVPIPDADEADELEDRLDHLDRLQKEIDERASTRSTIYNVMWRQFWNMSVGVDEA